LVDGQPVVKKGFTVSYGIGTDSASADKALYADKVRRLALGERAEPKHVPQSIVDVPQEPGIGSTAQPTGLDQNTPNEEVTPPQPPDPLAQKRAGVLDLIQNKPLAEVPEVLREPLQTIYQETVDDRCADQDGSLFKIVHSGE
jgi:hypothetical protein